jgi:hypothetical protein
VCDGDLLGIQWRLSLGGRGGGGGFGGADPASHWTAAEVKYDWSVIRKPQVYWSTDGTAYQRRSREIND